MLRKLKALKFIRIKVVGHTEELQLIVTIGKMLKSSVHMMCACVVISNLIAEFQILLILSQKKIKKFLRPLGKM